MTPRLLAVIKNALAVALGYFGTAALHNYAEALLITNPRFESWQAVTIRYGLEVGAALVVLATVLTIWRGFRIPYSLLSGFGLAVMNMGFQICC